MSYMCQNSVTMSSVFCLYGYISFSPSNRQTPVSQLGPFARFSPENSCDAAKCRTKSLTRCPIFGQWLEILPAKRAKHIKLLEPDTHYRRFRTWTGYRTCVG